MIHNVILDVLEAKTEGHILWKVRSVSLLVWSPAASFCCIMNAYLQYSSVHCSKTCTVCTVVAGICLPMINKNTIYLWMPEFCIFYIMNTWHIRKKSGLLCLLIHCILSYYAILLGIAFLKPFPSGFESLKVWFLILQMKWLSNSFQCFLKFNFVVEHPVLFLWVSVFFSKYRH